jgi:hypothetical protein
MIAGSDIDTDNPDIAPLSSGLSSKSSARTKPQRRKTQGAPATPSDPWAHWKPDWGSKKNTGDTVHARQEKISPTDIAAAHTTEKNRKVDDVAPDTRRRITDARLWSAMTPVEQNAAILIATAYQTMGRGIGYVTSDWLRVPGSSGGGSMSDAHARLVTAYVEWAERCAREKISHAMIIDILAFGFSCRAVDRDRRLRTGSARQNLLAGLKLYCRLQGWK